MSKANLDAAPPAQKERFQGATAALQPYIDAHRFRPFHGSVDVVPGVRSLPSPGHTPGHTSYLVESRGHEMAVVGDIVHVEAVQFDDPAVTISFDVDRAAAARTRRVLFDEFGESRILVGAAHRPFPGLGHVQVSPHAVRWVPVDYSTQFPE